MGDNDTQVIPIALGYGALAANLVIPKHEEPSLWIMQAANGTDLAASVCVYGGDALAALRDALNTALPST